MAGTIATATSCDWCTPDWIIEAVHAAFGGPPALDPCSNPWSRVRAGVEYTLEKNNDGLVDSWDYSTVFVNPPFGKGWWKPREHDPECHGSRRVLLPGERTDDWCSCGAAGKRDYIWPSDRQDMQARIKAGTMTKKEMQAILKPYTMADLGSWIKRCAEEGEERGIIGLIPAYPGTKAWHEHVWPKARAIFWPKGRIHFRLVYQLPEGGTVEKTGPAPMDCAVPFWGDYIGLEAFVKAFESRKGYIEVLR